MTEWWSGDNIGNLRKGFVMRVGKIGVIVIGLVAFWILDKQRGEY